MLISARQDALQRSFGFPFPGDFFQFWDLLQGLGGRGISLQDSLGISPANVFGVFDDPPASEMETPFYRDPPEFITLLLGDTDGLHWGYYADDPSAGGPFAVASYYHNDAYELSLDDNLLQAVGNYSDDLHEQVEDLIDSDPGSEETYLQRLQQIEKLQEVLAADRTAGVERHPVAPTRDGAGIVVPAGTYAPLAKVDPFQDAAYSPTAAEVERLRKAALDASRNGYGGTALKLGKDLWDYAEFFEVSCELLAAAYEALQRPVLRKRLDNVRQFRSAEDERVRRRRKR